MRKKHISKDNSGVANLIPFSGPCEKHMSHYGSKITGQLNDTPLSRGVSIRNLGDANILI